jgi:hypothetical protein
MMHSKSAYPAFAAIILLVTSFFSLAAGVFLLSGLPLLDLRGRRM